ncbi:Rho termination factor [Jatrophihabitans endophyticus]|uniref:DUF7218 family protein n=1 Tax=Jatrophihabitans endophyticus TaxID=1206085 RepID=UPI0019E23380|nr:Rho termination factor [Jatrophihabitans endophyticus]MBE7187295.1 Rho termination factor [Jatrophihabitans endophyticus]
MPGGKKPGPSVKDDKVYEKLRDEGASKSKAARIANAGAARSRSKVAKKGGKSPSYEDWKRDDLEKQAKKVGVKGRSKMKKKDLVKALRNS